MQAQLLHKCRPLSEQPRPLSLERVEAPRPRPGELLVRIAACGVCHTELDEIEGRTPPPRFPVIPGHQVVGRVVAAGSREHEHRCGQRVGVAWIHSTCGRCRFCLQGRENLCPDFLASGRDVDGGYAELMTVPAEFALPIPEELDDLQAAPLLCAGAIGHRSLKLTGLRNGEPLGLTGFGGSGHLVLQLARHLHPDSPIYVFARSSEQRRFAHHLGADWAGAIGVPPPAPPGAIIDTTPAWGPVLASLSVLSPGGRLVINAIRKEDRDREKLLDLDYPRHLWLEKEIRSVANVCRADVKEFLGLAARLSIRPHVRTYPLAQANQALLDLRNGHGQGAKVLVIGDEATGFLPDR